MKISFISILLVCIMIFCGCTNEVKESISFEESTKINNDTISGESANVNSDHDVFNESTNYHTEYNVDAIVLDSLTENVTINIPYTPSYSNALGVDIVQAMANNPIDKAFEEEWSKSDCDYTTLMYLVKNKYSILWSAEIDYAIEALATKLDENKINEIIEYSDNFLETSLNKIAIEQSVFLRMDYDVYMGTMCKYAIGRQIMDTYRELTFTLKYWMYLMETENYKEKPTTYLSMKFVYPEN